MWNVGITLSSASHTTSLHHSTSNTISDIIPNHTTFRVTPSFLSRSHISYHHRLSQHTSTSQYHISNLTISAALCIAYCTPFHNMYHIPCTPRHISDHTIYWPHYATHHHVSHHAIYISDIAPHFTCSTSCIIPPHLTVIAPNSTSHYHVSNNTSYTTTFYIPPHHISHDDTTTSTTTVSQSQPTLYLIPHHTTFHIPSHSPHSTSFHILSLIHISEPTRR